MFLVGNLFQDLCEKKRKYKQVSPPFTATLSQPCVNLAGAVSLTEVKALMTDWIKSSASKPSLFFTVNTRLLYSMLNYIYRSISVNIS